MKVYFHTFGCKANQYDTERMRQAVEALGAEAVTSSDLAETCVVNTCTVTNQADADARRAAVSPRHRAVVRRYFQKGD